MFDRCSAVRETWPLSNFSASDLFAQPYAIMDVFFLIVDDRAKSISVILKQMISAVLPFVVLNFIRR